MHGHRRNCCGELVPVVVQRYLGRAERGGAVSWADQLVGVGGQGWASRSTPQERVIAVVEFSNADHVCKKIHTCARSGLSVSNDEGRYVNHRVVSVELPSRKSPPSSGRASWLVGYVFGGDRMMWV